MGKVDRVAAHAAGRAVAPAHRLEERLGLGDRLVDLRPRPADVEQAVVVGATGAPLPPGLRPQRSLLVPDTELGDVLSGEGIEVSLQGGRARCRRVRC